MPARDYVIITDTHDDIFSSDTTQHIEYIETSVKNSHFEMLMHWNQLVISGGLDGIPAINNR